MSLVPRNIQGISMHGGDSAAVGRELTQWVNQYNDITVTGKTNFNNDIRVSYDNINFLNVSIDSEANTTLDITNSYNNKNLSEFIFNNKININNGLTVQGDSIIGSYMNDILIVNSTSEFLNDTSFKKNVTIEKNTTIEGNLTITGSLSSGSQVSAPVVSSPLTALSTSTTGAPVNDSGVLIIRGTSDNAFIGWDESADNFIMGTGAISVTDAGNLSITPGDLQIANIISSGTIQTNNLNVNGNVGIGTDNPQSKLHISSGTSGDCELILEADTDNNNEADNPRILFRQDGGNDWSMIGNDNDNHLVLANSVTTSQGILFKTGTTNGYTNATERMRIDSAGNVGIGTNNPSEKLEVNGKLKVNDDITSTGNIISHNFIYNNITGNENLYYWSGKNNFTTSTEPFVGNNSFIRFSNPNGISLNTTSHDNSYWNYSNMFQLGNNISVDARPPNAFSTSYKYAKFSLPVKPGISNSLFIKGITTDRWQSYVVFVNNENGNGSYGYYRLEARTNSVNGAGSTGVSSWIGPNAEPPINDNGYHEWIQFYIPQYIIDNYCYTTTDDKSKYRKNINIYLIRGYGSHDNVLWISGLAMRENPIDLVITNALTLEWYLNGSAGTDPTWNSGSWNREALIQFNSGTSYKLLIPIPNKKDPAIYGYPNFILGTLTLESYNTYGINRRYVYLENDSNTSDTKNLGKFTRSNVGTYGLFIKERHRHPLGLIVPKLPYNSPYVRVVQNRPYIKIKTYSTTHTAHIRGFYTEILDYTDNHKNMNMDGDGPVTY